MSTAKEIKKAISKRETYTNGYVSRLCLLYNNSVSVENNGDLPKRYLLKILREYGAIAYDKTTELFLRFTERGIDIYGLPTEYVLYGYNGIILSRKPDEVIILRANDLRYPFQLYFEAQAEKITDIDLAIEQNLEATRTMTVAGTNDIAAFNSLCYEREARRLGATVIFKKSGANTITDFTVQSTGAQFLVDKLLQARREVFNETLSTIGISVANTDKRERVQTEEIRASEGYAIDCISTLVDTFNNDAQVGGLAIRLKQNTSLYDDKLIQREEKNDTI